MFKSIAIFKRIDRAIKSGHCLGVASSRASNSDSLTRSRTNFGESPANSNLVSMIRSAFVTEPKFAADSARESAESALNSDPSPFEESLNNCADLASLLKLIEPDLSDFGRDELATVYYRISQLFFHSLLNFSGLQSELKKKAQTSPVFQSLLAHTDNLVDQLSPDCLIKVFETFEWIDLDPQSRQFKNMLNELNSRLDTFELEQVVNCLNLFVYHAEKPFATNELLRVADRFAQVAKRRIQADDPGLQAIDTIVKCFFSFLNSRFDPDNVIVDHLVERLQSPDVHINFKQSVRLLKEIQKNYILSKETRTRRMCYPVRLSNLIEKCNATIYQTFSVDGPTDQELYFYLINLHRYTMTSDFSKLAPNFFDENQNRLLSYLAPFLLDRFNFNERIPFFICNLVQNYANFNIYDYRLLRLVYNLFVTVDSFRAQMNVCHFYNLLARFKLPFVDHQLLTDLFLAELTDRTHKSFVSAKKDRTILLINLALNNVANGPLFDHLVDQLNHLDDRFYRQFNFRDMTKMTLARASLEFSPLDEQYRHKVRSKFDEMIDRCLSNISVGLSNQYIKIDARLQRDGFLSNGVHLGTFGIYDKSTRKLVPLTDHIDCFYKVDRIPARLPKNQTM